MTSTFVEPTILPDEAPLQPSPKGIELVEYVVINDGISVRWGPRRDDVKFVAKGRPVKLDPALVNIEKLIQLRAIAVNDGLPKVRTNAMMAAQATGSADDPVAIPVLSYIPETPVPTPAEAQAIAANALPEDPIKSPEEIAAEEATAAEVRAELRAEIEAEIRAELAAEVPKADVKPGPAKGTPAKATGSKFE